MTSSVRRFADVVPLPWRNGLGRTSELVDDATAATLTPGHAWWLSIAELDAPVPFSTFPGLQRTLVPWGGDLWLRLDDGIHHVRAGAPIRFPGDAATVLTRLERPCHAINLMAATAAPTLVPLEADERSDADELVVLGSDGPAGALFDLVRVPAGTRMPAPGVAIRL